MNNPTNHLREYLSISGVTLPDDLFNNNQTENTNPTQINKPIETL